MGKAGCTSGLMSGFLLIQIFLFSDKVCDISKLYNFLTMHLVYLSINISIEYLGVIIYLKKKTNKGMYLSFYLMSSLKTKFARSSVIWIGYGYWEQNKTLRIV